MNAILVNFHRYQPYGSEYYAPILKFFVHSMKRWKDEYDHIYFLDSTWGITPEDIKELNASIIKTDPSMRYYDTYKSVLPQIDADTILFLDNDMIIYRQNVILGIFESLFGNIHHINVTDQVDVVSIYDTIGEKTYPELNGQSKFCPYLFAARKELLLHYLDCEWGPNMPEHETLGKLTEKILADGKIPYEYQEDKSSIFFDDTQDGKKSKNLGYYHIRAGSVPAYLLSEKKYGNKETYLDYIHNQPKREYLRQIAWYWLMIEGDPGLEVDVLDMIEDIDPELVRETDFPFLQYFEKMKRYHGLPR